jgi:hypothetical protein
LKGISAMRRSPASYIFEMTTPGEDSANGLVHGFATMARVAIKLVVGGLLGVGISVAWFLSPSLHVVEIVNATSFPLHEVALRLPGDGEIDVGDLAPGATITRRTWHTSRSSGPVTITSLEGGRREVLATCGYVAFGPSKHRIRIAGPTMAGGDCKSHLRLVGWPW